MKFLIQLMIIYGINIRLRINSLVMIKLDPGHISKYYKSMRKNIEDKIEISFSETNRNDYCHELRQAETYVLDNNATNATSPPIYHVILTQDDLTAEENQHGILLMKFQSGIFLRPQNHKSFKCLDSNGEPKWFITPAFIPDSSFLFSVEPSFKLVFSKNINGGNEIPVILEAIIDESAEEIGGREEFAISEREKLTSSRRTYEQSGYTPSPDMISRDPLCDLNRILQYRLCSIASAAVLGYPEPSTDHRIFFRYPPKHYHLPENTTASCQVMKLRKALPRFRDLNRIQRKVLHCLIKSTMPNSTMHLYLSQQLSKISEITYMAKYTNSPGFPPVFYGVLRVPLLKHIETYNKVLGNDDIFID